MHTDLQNLENLELSENKVREFRRQRSWNFGIKSGNVQFKAGFVSPYRYFSFQMKAMNILKATFELKHHVILTCISCKMALEDLKLSGNFILQNEGVPCDKDLRSSTLASVFATGDVTLPDNNSCLLTAYF